MAAREEQGDLLADQVALDDENDVVETGAFDLDPILSGGIPRGGLALVLGQPGFFATPVTYLLGLKVTTYLTCERAWYGAALDLAETSLLVLAENLRFLRAVGRDGRLRRLLSIVRTRSSDRDHRFYEYTIRGRTGHGDARRSARGRLWSC